MVIHGLQKLTLLDYPGHTACTVFTARCNWRCPFCHNASLVLRPDSQPVIGEQTFCAFLEKRRGLLDGVAVTGGEPMDIKAGRDNYPSVTGTLRPSLAAVEESVKLLKAGRTEHEFRTTVVKELHTDADFEDIGLWLAGEERYFLQAFKDSGDLLTTGCSGCTREEMEHFLQIAQKNIPGAAIRGMD